MRGGAPPISTELQRASGIDHVEHCAESALAILLQAQYFTEEPVGPRTVAICVTDEAGSQLALRLFAPVTHAVPCANRNPNAFVGIHDRSSIRRHVPVRALAELAPREVIWL
jgi:hypothetical protein